MAGEWLAIGLVMSFLTGPQSLVTYALFGLWSEGKRRVARVLSALCGLLGPLFWLFCWHGLELSAQWGHRNAAPLFGALLLLILWGLLFPIFAILARPSKL